MMLSSFLSQRAWSPAVPSRATPGAAKLRVGEKPDPLHLKMHLSLPHFSTVNRIHFT
jgi:hypothetical protein